MKMKIGGIIFLLVTFLAPISPSWGDTTCVSKSVLAGQSSVAYQGPISGPLADLGQSQIQAATFAVKQFNSQNSTNIGLISFDDQGSPTLATACSQSIVNTPSVLGVFGLPATGAAIAAQPAFQQANTPMLSVSASNPALSNLSKYSNPNYVFHRLVASYTQEGTALLDQITNYFNQTIFAYPITVISDGSSHANSITQQMQSEAKLLGVSLTISTVTDKNSPNFSDSINQINSNKDIMVIYVGFYNGAADYVTALRNSGFQGKFYADDGAFDPQFITLAGQSSENSILVNPEVPLDLANPGEYSALETYGIKNGNGYLTQTIDAADILLSGMAHGASTRDALENYLNSYTGVGVAGNNISFQSDGDLKEADLALYEVKNGQFTYQGLAPNRGSAIAASSPAPVPPNANVFQAAGIGAVDWPAKCPEVLDSVKSSEPQVIGFTFGGPNDQTFARLANNSANPVTSPENLVGCYVDLKNIYAANPSWQIGAISRDSNGYYWTNAAGVTWRLTFDGTNLITGSDNPYNATKNKFVLNYGNSLASTAAANPASSRPAPKASTLRCYKSAKTLKVTGINPKCPKGYSIKK